MQLRPAVGVPIDANFLTIYGDLLGEPTFSIFRGGYTSENYGQG